MPLIFIHALHLGPGSIREIDSKFKLEISRSGIPAQEASARLILAFMYSRFYSGEKHLNSSNRSSPNIA